ncbi:MAG: DnaD domain protein [Blautia sp.]|nr:DnaD domain protein [Blautia sp.]
MGIITIQNESRLLHTMVPNWFIDQYVPKANGEFVKVYLTLLRLVSGKETAFDLSRLADFLLCTERDVVRAVKYWEKEGLLSLSFASDKSLESISFCHTRDEAVSPAAVREEEPVDFDLVTDSASDSPEKRKENRPSSLTPERVEQLKADEGITQLLFIAEQYMKKTLSSSEMRKILSFYEELGMSVDLIEYLIEYCVSHNHRSMRYMETVAAAWAKDGITSVQMAKESVSAYRKDYYTILKAMGVKGRDPVNEEIVFMDRWMNEFGFDLPIIQEACSRTILKLGQPSFQYTEGILSDWKNRGVHYQKDIDVLDEEHKKKQKEAREPREPRGGQRKTGTNRFSNFPQREYDFEDYEKQLLDCPPGKK